MKKKSYSKYDVLFMVDYNLKEFETYCANDDCYEARYTTKEGKTEKWCSSRERVMEHVRKTSKYPERYEQDKDLIVAHFRLMARVHYAHKHILDDV